MDTLGMDYDTLWTHEDFHGRKQEESVILKGIHGWSYVKVHLLFKVYLSSTMYDVAFIQDYSVVPHSMVCEDDHDTGFQCLMLDDSPSGMRFISPEEFICAAFVVNTDDNCINCYFMNDLVDNDMYLQLN